MNPTKEQIETLVNNLNVGTNKAKLGEIFVALLTRVEKLEAVAPGAFGKQLVATVDQAAAKTLLGIA